MEPKPDPVAAVGLIPTTSPMAEPPKRIDSKLHTAVDDFLREHPNGVPDVPVSEPQERAAVIPAGLPPLEIDDEKPAVETPAAETPAPAETPATPVVAETPASAEPKAATPDAKPATTESTPAPTTPVATAPATAPAPAPVAIDPKEPIVLKEGAQPWTREQIVTALSERPMMQAAQSELEQMRGFFGYKTFAETKAAWEPILGKLVEKPQVIGLMHELLDNPEKLEYITGAAENYDQSVGYQPPKTQLPTTLTQQQQPVARLDPATEARLAQFEQYTQQQAKQAAQDRFNREMAQATSRWPMLATDANLRNDLITTAGYLWNIDTQRGVPEAQRRGLIDAMNAKASIYDALMLARSAPAAAPAPAPTPAAAVNLSTGGASPSVSDRPHERTQPKVFKSPDEALADWMKNTPKQFRNS